MVSQHPDSATGRSPAPDRPKQQEQVHSEWFYTQRGETYGPVSSTELRAAAHLGFLGPNDLVLRKGQDAWIVASKIQGLFNEAR